VISDGLIKWPFSAESDPIYVFVHDCAEKEGIKTVYNIGLNGGYYFKPNLSTESNIPIYYKDGINYMPSKEDVEREIFFSMNESLFLCTKSFIDFPELNISQGKIRTKTKMTDKKVVLDITYPIYISKGESTTLIQDFKVEVPVRMKTVYESISRYMDQQMNFETICLSCLLDISLENDLYVDMMDYDDETTIFIFRDENSKINNETFIWVFANKYEVEK
tara:strand:+ start:2465 stop:3124 length:660 start_codon:yes stop_codon:yes gene_type:complete